MDIIIYFLIDPRDESICYVGQTRRGAQRRLKDHLRMISNPKHHGMQKLYNWIASLDRIGLQPEIRVVECLTSVSQLDEAEIYWGELCRSLGCPLKNVAAFGCSGRWALTDTGRLSIKDRTGEKHQFFGKSHKPSTIEKMKKAHAGKTWTPEQIEKSASARRKPFICVETGQVFSGMRDAITTFGFGKQYILAVLRGDRESVKGHSFRYVEKT